MPDEPRVDFSLYVAGNLPHSLRALSNLRAFCVAHLPDRHFIEVVDVFEAPERALQDNILLTPQLILTTGDRVLRIVGDLSDPSPLLLAFKCGTVP